MLSRQAREGVGENKLYLCKIYISVVEIVPVQECVITLSLWLQKIKFQRVAKHEVEHKVTKLKVLTEQYNT